MTRIGYFIPEFPGQTHIFFWREYKGLLARGIEPLFISTRKPPPGIISHAWAEEAMARTHYLAPPRASELALSTVFGTLKALARSRPSGWAACLGSIARAEGLDARGRMRLGALALAGARLAALAGESGFSHVHVHSCADSAHVAMFAHLLSGISYSLTLHGPLRYFGPNQLEKWRHAAFAIVITQRLLQEVREELASALPPRVEVAPMGVELTKFRRDKDYEPWRGEGPLRIFACGRLNPGKGHDDLARAVRRLREEGIDARARIAGEDEKGGTGYRRDLERILADLGVADSVALLGAVSEERIRSELENAHIFALASHEEALGVATMEAMAMSVPAVVTGVGGVPELVTNGEDGLLVDPGHPEHLAARILELARAPDRALRLSAAGRAKIERAFDSERSVETLTHLLPRA